MPTPWVVQIAERSQDRLVITEPGYGWIQWALVAAAILFALLGVLVPSARFLLRIFGAQDYAPPTGVQVLGVGMWAMRIVFFLLAIAFAMIGLRLRNSSTSAIFSRPEGTLHLRSGFYRTQRDIPLSTIVEAKVAGDVDRSSVLVVLRSGEAVRLTSISNRSGQHAAAEAINEFLAGKTSR